MNMRRCGLRPASRTAAAAVLALAAGLSSPVAGAQVASEGKGTLTLQVGEGYLAVGGIANQVAGLPADGSTLHATSFRFLAGYHFAEHLSFDVGVAHLGTLSSHAPYAATDTLSADVTATILEAELVAKIPIAANARIDLTGGIAESALHSVISTQRGSALPPGETGDDTVRRLGATAGADFEWRLSDVTSIIVGYHVYTHVGSPKLADSAAGTAKAILAGVHFEF